MLRFLRGDRPPLRLRGFCLDGEQLRGILKLGVTGFTFKVTNSLTQAAVNVMLKSWGGALSTLYIGAMGLINSLREIMSLPANGVTTAGQNVMSFNYGAKRYDRVSESIRFTLAFSLGINALVWTMIQFVPAPLIRLFTSDAGLIRQTVRCARIYFGAFPFMALQLTGQTTFVALNYPRYALFFSMLRKVALVLPLTLLLPGLGLGVEGVFWAEFASQVIGATACFVTMYRVIWRRMRAGDPAR